MDNHGVMREALASAGQVGGKRHEMFPSAIRASAERGPGFEYDARRLRSQRDVIRDVMLAADECGSWLTLRELHKLTHYGEASISAQLRHLRKAGNGGVQVMKRFREDGVWEYRLAGA